MGVPKKPDNNEAEGMKVTSHSSLLLCSCTRLETLDILGRQLNIPRTTNTTY